MHKLRVKKHQNYDRGEQKRLMVPEIMNFWVDR